MMRRFFLLLLVVFLLAGCCSAESPKYQSQNAFPAENAVVMNEEAGGSGAEGLTDVGYAPAGVPVLTPEEMLAVEDGDSKNIVGSDDRQTISSTSTYPYSAIAYMEMHMSCGCDATGTGFMVSRNALMTAGHCLVCQTHGGTAERIDFWFGYKSNKNYYYKYSDSVTYWYGADFASGTYWDYRDSDYGFVRFNSNVGEKTGWFGYWVLSDSQTEGKYVNMASYRFGVMKLASGNIHKYSNHMINYTIDTEPGNSGGPLFVYEDNNYYAVAINTAYSFDGTMNYGYRIDDGLISKMKSEGLFGNSTTVAQNDNSGTSIVGTGGSSNIRSAPSLNGSILGTLPKGASASYLGSTQYDDRGVAWYNIRYNGITGWVSSKYTTKR